MSGIKQQKSPGLIQLGTEEKPLHIDPGKLMETRLLVVANSGGGKSFLLRQLAEKVAGFSTVIVLDSEGEFASLREASTLRDALLVGELVDQADVQIRPEVAGPLGAALVSKRQHAVVDLSDLKLEAKQQYIADFLNAILRLPKEDRHGAVIVIDDAHTAAPAYGAPPSRFAMVDLMSLGRKHGLCVAIATQRITKVDSNVISECNAVLVGRTRHDRDQERAAEILGLTKGGGKTLACLEPGEFWAIGPVFAEAFDEEGDEDSYKFQAGKPHSTHPTMTMPGKMSVPRTQPSADTAEKIYFFANLESADEAPAAVPTRQSAPPAQSTLGLLENSIGTALARWDAAIQARNTRLFESPEIDNDPVLSALEQDVDRSAEAVLTLYGKLQPSHLSEDARRLFESVCSRFE